MAKTAPSAYQTRTAPPRGSWEITRWRDRNRYVWDRQPGGRWVGWANAAEYPDHTELAAAHGPLVPLAVSDLAAVLAELETFRAVLARVRVVVLALAADTDVYDHELAGYRNGVEAAVKELRAALDQEG